MARTDGLKPFKKGVSGNPSGRPKVPVEVMEIARAASPDAIRTLSAIMKDEGAPPAARVSAAEKILDRAYGKPAQTVDMTVTNKPLAEWDEAELDRRIALALTGEETPGRGSSLSH